MCKKYHSMVIATLYFTVCFLLMSTSTACAYIDPSTTTYVIQAVAGIAIAIGAFVAVYWRKAKKKVQNALHIDENANKVMEDELVVTDDVKNDGKDA